MTDAKILALLGRVQWEPSCVVADDPGEVVRHAAPLDAAARQAIREQQIARMTYDAAAVRAREVRLAMASGRVMPFRARGRR